MQAKFGRIASRECERMCFHIVVPAHAGTHTARNLVSALGQKPFFTFEARGDGSLRAQGRLAESYARPLASLRIPAHPLHDTGPTRHSADVRFRNAAGRGFQR